MPGKVDDENTMMDRSTSSGSEVLATMTTAAAISTSTTPVLGTSSAIALASTRATTPIFQISMTIIVGVVILIQMMVVIVLFQRRAASILSTNNEHQKRLTTSLSSSLSSFLRLAQPVPVLILFIFASTVTSSSALLFLYINNYTCQWREPLLYFSITAMFNTLATKLWRSITLMSPILKQEKRSPSMCSSSNNSKRSRIRGRRSRMLNSNKHIQQKVVNFMFLLSDGWERLCYCFKKGNTKKKDLTASSISTRLDMSTSRHGIMSSSRHDIINSSRHTIKNSSRHNFMDSSRHGSMNNSRHNIMNNSRNEIMNNSRHNIMNNSRHGMMLSSNTSLHRSTTNLLRSSSTALLKQQKSFKSIRRTIPLHKMFVVIGILQLPQFILQLCNVVVPALRQHVVTLDVTNSSSSMPIYSTTCGAASETNNTTMLIISRSLSILLTTISFLLMFSFAWWSSESPRMFNEWNNIRSSTQVFAIVAVITGPRLLCFTTSATSPNAKAFAQIALIFGTVLPLLWCLVGQRVIGTLLNHVWKTCMFNNHTKKGKNRSNKPKLRTHDNNNNNNNKTNQSSSGGLMFLKPITSQERVAHLALNIESLYEGVGSNQIHSVKLFQEALYMWKFDPYHETITSNHQHNDALNHGDIEEGNIASTCSLPDGNATSSNKRNMILPQKHQVVPRRHRAAAVLSSSSGGRTRRSQSDIHHKNHLIGGFTEMEVNSFSARDLQYILTLTVTKAKTLATHRGYDTKGQNSAARTWMDALDLYECCPEGSFLQDKTILFSIFSGLFINLRRSIIYDPSHLFESELIENFVNDFRLIGDPIHFGRALAMKAAFVVRVNEQYEEALILVEELVQDVYVLEEHTVGLTQAYGSDRCAQIIAQSTLWQMELDLEEEVLTRCQYVIQDLLPYMDLKNVFNSTTLLLPVLRVMKYKTYTRTNNDSSVDNHTIEAGTSTSSLSQDELRNIEQVQQIFHRYIMKPYREYIEKKGGTTIWQSLYKPLEILFYVQTSYCYHYYALKSSSSSPRPDASTAMLDDDAISESNTGLKTTSSSNDKITPTMMKRTISLFNESSITRNGTSRRSLSVPNLYQLSSSICSSASPIFPDNTTSNPVLSQSKSESFVSHEMLLEYSNWILQDDNSNEHGGWASKLELVVKATLEVGGWDPNTIICEICLYLIKQIQLLPQQDRHTQSEHKKDSHHHTTNDMHHICHLLLHKGLTLGRTTLHKLWFGYDADNCHNDDDNNNKNNVIATTGRTCSNSDSNGDHYTDANNDKSNPCSSTSDDEEHQQGQQHAKIIISVIDQTFQSHTKFINKY